MTRNARQQRGALRVIGVLLTLLLAACSGAAETTSTGGAEADVADTPDGTADETESDAESSERGGTFTFGVNAAPPTLNPATGDPAFNPLYQWAYDPLVVLEPDGSFSPGLAVEFGYTDSENRVYELTLREGVTFSDGAALDAEAVKAYLEYLKAQSTSPGLLVQSIDTIEVTSPMSLRLNLNRSDPGYSFYFAQAFGAGYIASPQAVADPTTLDSGTAGAGQYTIDPDRTVAGDRYTYVANPDYWDPEAVQFDEVVVQVIANSSSMIQALAAGQIQAGAGDATTLQAAEAAGLQVISAPQALSGLNLMDRDGALSEPLADPRVRQALNLAVDREAVAAALYGDGDLALTQYALPGTIGADPALDVQQAHDPEQAAALLTEAGYPDGFTLEVLTVPLAGLDRLTTAIAGELANIGVTLEVETKPLANDYFTSMIGGEFPAAVLAYGLNDMNSLYTGYVSPQAPFNPFQASDPELDALYEEYFATPPEESGPIQQQINAKLVELAWALPVVGAPLAYYVTEGYTGLEATTGNSAVPHFTELRTSSS